MGNYKCSNGQISSIFWFVISAFILYVICKGIYGILTGGKFLIHIFGLSFFVVLLYFSARAALLSYVVLSFKNFELNIKRPFLFYNPFRKAIRDKAFDLSTVSRVLIIKSDSFASQYTNRMLFFKKNSKHCFLLLEVSKDDLRYVIQVLDSRNLTVEVTEYLDRSWKNIVSRETEY